MYRPPFLYAVNKSGGRIAAGVSNPADGRYRVEVLSLDYPWL